MLIVVLIVAAALTGVAVNWILEAEDKPAPVRIPVNAQDRKEIRRRGN